MFQQVLDGNLLLGKFQIREGFRIFCHKIRQIEGRDVNELSRIFRLSWFWEILFAKSPFKNDYKITPFFVLAVSYRS